METLCGFYCLITTITVLITIKHNSFLTSASASHWHLQNVSDLLDNILQPEKGYQKVIRPGHGGAPTEVLIDLYVKSMGPISEEQMIYSMDCYFRQTWMDRRLSFRPLDNHMTTLKMDFKMLDQLWKPDTYFLNGRGSYLHTVTYPNKLLRINTDGLIIYSQRLTIVATCPMDLRKYPMDNQTCPLLIGSYAYGHDEVVYSWKKGPKNSLDYSKDLRMAQFTLVNWMGYNTIVPRPLGNASVVVMNFMLERSIGYCVLQTYMPLYMIVVISWVSFWINREATPARVTLGITTILTTSTIKLVGVSGLPKLSYNTALDYFLHLSFFFVFAALVEYAGVNYFTKSPEGGAPINLLEDDEDDTAVTAASPLVERANNGKRFCNGRTRFFRLEDGREYCCSAFLNCIRGNSKYRFLKSKKRQMDGVNSVSRIDETSRIVFPVSFIIINTLYWLGYLYYL